MEQLWYTWSINGPKTGFQIRATSQGLEESGRTSKLLSYVGYRLPEGTVTYDINPKDAPIALSFTDTRDYGYILVRKVYKGLDGAGRPGAFFSHLVLLNELSKPFTVREAIELWASRFWRESESASDQRTLPSLKMPEDLFPTKASPFEQFDRSVRPALGTLFASVLLAFLTYENKRRFYILAPSQVVTAMIWGLAHSLPSTLRWWGDMTFTTYDDDISKASEFIVGTFRFPTSRFQDLPEEYYNGNRMAIKVDPETLEIARSFLPGLSNDELYREYAFHAAGCLTNCSMQDLSNLVSSAERNRIDNVPEFLDLYRKVIAGQPLTLEELLEALRKKTPNEEQLAKPVNQKSLVSVIIDKVPGVPEALHAFYLRSVDEPDAFQLRKLLIEVILAALRKAVLQDNAAAALLSLLEALVLLAPAREYETVWRDLLHNLSPLVDPFAPVASNSLFPWPTRRLLLSQWVQIILQPQIEKELQVWLQVAWGDLGELLASVPQECRKLAITFRLAKSEPIPADVVAGVAGAMQRFGNSLFKPVLVEYFVIQKPSSKQIGAVGIFIEQILKYKLPLRLEFLFETLTADTSGYISQRLNMMNEGVLQREDLVDFVQNYIPSLFQHGLHQPAVMFINTLIGRYFDAYQVPEIESRLPVLLELIARLYQEIQRAISVAEAAQVRALLVVKVVDTLRKIVRDSASATFFLLLQALGRVAPVDIGPAGIDAGDANAWKDILGFLPSPDPLFPWGTRELLLQQWIKIANQVQEHEIARWLNVSWGELEGLVALPVPEMWRWRAIELRIEDEAALPREADAIIRKYADRLFAPTLERFVANGTRTQAEMAVRFVKKLLLQESPRRLQLLLMILKADKEGYVTTRLLDDLDLGDDLFDLVEHSLQKLMPYAGRKHITQFILYCLDLYFKDLKPRDLITNKSTKNLLDVLSQGLSLQLPQELDARIRGWQEIARFLELGTDAANLREVTAFTDALTNTELTVNVEQLSDTIAIILASRDFEEEQVELARIVDRLGNALVSPRVLLKKMAEVVGEIFGAEPGKIFPYILLVLQDAHSLEGEMKESFLAIALNHLLKQITSKEDWAFQLIEGRVTYLSSGLDRKEWREYVEKSRFTRILKPGPTLPWYHLLPRHWKVRRILRNLRAAIQERMTTTIARIAIRLLPPDYNYLNEDEKDMVRMAMQFDEVFKVNYDEKIVEIYNEIWEKYQGRLYFNPEELKRIREAEEKMLAREEADR